MARSGVNNKRSKRRDRDDKRGRNKDGQRKRDQAARTSSSRTESSKQTPARNASPTRELRRLLAGIGTPAPAPFEPDPFQLAALAALEHEDVLVTAPTGSGKTWIAREEIRRLLAAGRRVWYTTPLKALTNSKYHEFTAEFGTDKVGILTGDRKENADAPVGVGTAEGYRNQ